jgi:hypothetical protein
MPTSTTAPAMAPVEAPPRPGSSPTPVTRQPGLDTRSTVSPLGLSRPSVGSSATAHAFWRAATDPDVFGWLDHVRPAAGCTHPIRLVGETNTVDTATGALLSQTRTADLPDGVIYKPCGNRRVTVCPSCAETYRRDAYQLIRAGLVGGKGIPDTIAAHPAVFATFTAPGFGRVHTRHVTRHTCRTRKACDCRPQPCHARRNTPACPHGRPAFCFTRHDPTDTLLGQPLCLDCYDHDHHTVWNYSAAELWRRTTIAITRRMRRIATTRGIHPAAVRLSYGKVAEMQRRGVVHFHAIIRLDGTDPHHTDIILPPPAALTVDDLVDAVEHAAVTTRFTTASHPDHPAGWPITWGDLDKGIEVRPVAVTSDGELTDGMVAGYLAKYATKSTESTGHLSRRLTGDTIDIHANPDGTHTERLIAACWRLGRPTGLSRKLSNRPRRNRAVTQLGPQWTCPTCAQTTRLTICPRCADPTTPTPVDTYVSTTDPDNPWNGLRRWAHMLGFGGHFLTKSRRYSITFRILRNNRIIYRRTETPPNTEAPPPDTTLVVNFLTFVGAGWHTTGDALLASTSAALARERQAAAREALADLQADIVP